MNKIFRIVFNTSTGRWVVASEMAKGRKKASASGKVGTAMAATLVTALAASGMASAGSVDGGTASGTGSVAVGPGSTAVTGGTAVGSGADSTANGATAIGLDAVASGTNSVALGANSVASRNNTVSVGASGAERQITSLAMGTADTDAVNVAQLKGVTSALGGGASVNPLTGAVTAPTYRIAGTNYNNVGAAFTAVDNSFVSKNYVSATDDEVGSAPALATGPSTTAIGASAKANYYSSAIGSNSLASGNLSLAMGYKSTASGNRSTALGAGTSALAYRSVSIGSLSKVEATADLSMVIGAYSLATAKNAVALGTSSVADRENTLSLGQAGAERQLVNLARGTAATDGVNVSQLEPVVAGLGGGASIDPNTGLVTGPTYNVTNVDGTQTSVNNVGDAITQIDGRTVQNTTAINNVTTNLNNGTIGPVQRTAAGQLSLIATGGDATAPGAAQVLTNVAKGAVKADSTDAVNGAQLFGLADSTADALGGGSTVNPDGSITAPTYNVNGTTVNNVGDAITNIDGRTTQNTTNIAGNTTAINNITNNINEGTIGLVQQAAAGQKLTVGKDTDGSEVDFADKAGTARKLTHVAAGTNAQDAVNVSQLKPVVDGLGGGSSIDPNTGVVTGPTYNVTNVDGTHTTLNNVGDAITNIDGRTVQNTTAITNIDGRTTQNTTAINNVTNSINNGTIGPVQRTAAGQLSLIAAGGDATAPGAAQVLTNVAKGAVKADSTDAVNGAQLFGLADSTADALGGGSTVNPDGSITAPTYNVNGTTVHNVGDAITNIDGRTTQNTTNIAGNTTAINNITNNINKGTIGLVQQAAAGQKLTVGKDTDGSEVDFADKAGTARKLTHVAAGTSAQDAVNVSQLKPVVDGLGGGASIDPNTGVVTGPTYNVTNVDGMHTTVHNVGDAITNIDGRTVQNTTEINNINTSISNGTIGPVQRTAAGQLSLIAAGGDATAPGAAQVLTNVAKGAVKADSTDAVNGAQLFGLADSTADALGGGSTVNPDGSITAPTYNVGGTTVNNVGDAITNIDGRTTQNTTNIAGNTTAINNITNSINKGTIGLVQQAAAGQKLTVGKDTDGSEVDFANKAGTARRLTRVAAGASAEDAVNVSQLKTVVDGLGGGASIDPNTGLVTGPTYNVTNVDGTHTSVNNVGDAITNIDGRVYSNTTQITHLTNQINNGTVGLVQQAGAGQQLTVGKDTDGSEVSFTNAAGEARKLSGVADGVVAAGSKDAVNGGQLHGVSQSMATALGGGSKVNADGSISSPTYVLTNADGSKSDVTGVEGAITNLDGRVHNNTTRIDNVETNVNNLTNQINSGAVGLVQQAAPGEQLTVGKATDGKSVNFTGTAGDRTLTGVAAGKADNDAVNVGQLKASGMIDEKGEAKVAVTYDSADKSDVTLGGAGAAKPVAMHNVADGVADHDAVNVAQLNSRLQAQSNTIISQVNSYTDDRFNKAKEEIDTLRHDVDDRFHVQDARIDRLSAMSTAMASMTSSMSGVNRINRMGVGAGETNGRLAIAVGYQRAFRDGGATLTAGASFTDEDSTVGVGAGFGW